MAAASLRLLLNDAKKSERCLLMPACHDAMSAKLIQQAGFKVAFMSGYAVSATHLALPDCGLISYGEQLQIGRCCVDATRGKLCIIGDGDTGFGGSGNVKRTIRGYAAAGFAAMSIEDQCYPKRCSYARGLAVEPRDAAITRVRAAVAARDEMREEGLDLLIIGRTDCRNAAEHGGLDEAIARCKAFAEAGCEVVYAEGLAGQAEMRSLNQALKGYACATMLAQVERPTAPAAPSGTAPKANAAERPLVPPPEAAKLGYTLSLMGLTILNVAIKAMTAALAAMASGSHPSKDSRLTFDELYQQVMRGSRIPSLCRVLSPSLCRVISPRAGRLRRPLRMGGSLPGADGGCSEGVGPQHEQWLARCRWDAGR